MTTKEKYKHRKIIEDSIKTDINAYNFNAFDLLKYENILLQRFDEDLIIDYNYEICVDYDESNLSLILFFRRYQTEEEYNKQRE